VEIPDRLEVLASNPVTSTLAGWCGAASGLDLAAADKDLLDLVLYVYPDLRATAYLGQTARDRGMGYPIADVEHILDVLGGARFEVGEIVVDESTIRDALEDEPFPLTHEGEFLSAIHRAIVRCRVRATLRRQAAARLGELDVEDGRRAGP
jgi:hypothetical protein